MTDAAMLAADPAWLPHRVDSARRRILFLGLDRTKLGRPGFLAERERRAPQAWLSLDQFVAASVAAAPIHFVFHSGFCRSTLLVRALDLPGVSMGLNEPGILNSLAKEGALGRELLGPVLKWLARPHAAGEAIIVKPSNYANALIEPMLQASPASRALLMTNPAAGFLTRVARKGFMGRLWGRQVLLELQKLDGKDLGLDMRAIAGLTDMQAAALGWFLIQQMFAALTDGASRDRVAILHGDRFNRERVPTLTALAKHFGLAISGDQAIRIATGPVFGTHAKGGGDFESAEAEAVERGASAVTDEEIAHVAGWVAGLGRRAGLTLPVPQTLY